MNDLRHFVAAFGGAVAELLIFFWIVFLAMRRSLGSPPAAKAWAPLVIAVAVLTLVKFIFDPLLAGGLWPSLMVWIEPIFVSALVLHFTLRRR